ncbi:cyclic nucleotide-binding domain-containing protein [Methylocapsa palsarum]|uniref:Cyclic nucleotide-binding domain-containing protein n=1 Tax=Methylocapsa palsarum TaxID=1612308 RepID=A0A1I3Z4E3_9HYPH|nr:cyclic nucleotide-binding domain-containing protein [Methylocapsa palsarum]SFK38880.1 Cyclic nucleotide-binding domain-containing protein [Methylocapsa palsarum]
MVDGGLSLINVVFSAAPRKPAGAGDYLFLAVEIVTWAEALSAIASARARGMIQLRSIALLNNVLGVLAGLGNGSLASVVKHTVNFPLNASRLRQMQKLVTTVKAASGSDLKLQWLKPFMHPRVLKKGEIIFSKGDDADEAFLIVSGRVEIMEASVALGPGEMLGEMALFTGRRQRTASAICATEAQLLFITYEAFEQLCFQNPEFGFYVTRLVARRCERDMSPNQSASGPALRGASVRLQEAAGAGAEPMVIHAPEAARRKLRALADEQGRPVGDLAAEALDLLFVKYGAVNQTAPAAFDLGES